MTAAMSAKRQTAATFGGRVCLTRLSVPDTEGRLDMSDDEFTPETEDDVEGHRTARPVIEDDDDVNGHHAHPATEDDDVAGHTHHRP